MKRIVRVMLPFIAALGFAVGASPAYASEPEWDFPATPSGRTKVQGNLSDPLVGSNVSIDVGSTSISTHYGHFNRYSINYLWGSEAYSEVDGIIIDWFADGNPIEIPTQFNRYVVPETALGKVLTARVSAIADAGLTFEPIEIPSQGDSAFTFGPVVYPSQEGIPRISIVEVGPTSRSEGTYRAGNELQLELSGDIPEGVELNYCWSGTDPSYNRIQDIACNQPLVLTNDLLNVKPFVIAHFSQPQHSTLTTFKAGRDKILRTNPGLEHSFADEPRIKHGARWRGNFQWADPNINTSSKYTFWLTTEDGKQWPIAKGTSKFRGPDDQTFDHTLNFTKWPVGKSGKVSLWVYPGGSIEPFTIDLGLELKVEGRDFDLDSDLTLEAHDGQPTTWYATVEKYPFKRNEYGGSNWQAMCTEGKISYCDFEWRLEGKRAQGVPDGEIPTSFDANTTMAGKRLTLSLSIHHPDYEKATFISDPLVIPKLLHPAAEIESDVMITGNSMVASKLSATGLKWNVPGMVNRYVWRVDGIAVPKTNYPTYTIRSTDVGKEISLTVYTANSDRVQAITSGLGPVATKSTPTIAAKLSAKSIKKSKSSKLTVTVKAPGTTRPVGSVKVTVGKKTFKASLKASHKGKATIKLKSLKVGKNQAVKVKFTPSSKSTGKFSKVSKTTTVAKITVKK